MNEAQLAYVRTAQSEGRSREEITTVLLGSGYTPEQIAALFTAVESGMAVPPPAPVGQMGVALLPRVGELLGAGFTLCKQRPELIVLLGALSVLSSVVGVVGEHSVGSMKTAAGLALLPLMLMSVVATLTTMRAVLTPGELLGDSFRWTLSNGFSILWVGILSMFAMFGGLPLFVPAVAIAGYVLLAQVVRIQERVRGINALVRSTVLVRGNWWAIFWRMCGVGAVMIGGVVLFLLLVALVAALFGVDGVLKDATEQSVADGLVAGTSMGIATAVMTAISFASLSMLYQSLRVAAPTFTPEQHPKLRRLYIALAIIGPFVLVAVVVLAAAIAARMMVSA